MNIILLSGGSGKRLWPLSNDIRSKQFIKIFETDNGFESMVQRVYRQITTVDPNATVTIATSKPQVSTVHNQLGENIGISVEPCRRDTFAAIALATAYLHDVKDVDENEAVVVCPVDPYVEDSYFRCVNVIYDKARQGDKNLVLMGIEPTYPSEKYGYIKPTYDQHGNCSYTFTEKPIAEKAKEYISGGALWNGGVFAYKLKYVLNKSRDMLGTSDYNELFLNYGNLEKISFDYAVVEHETRIEVVRYNGTWKDLGTWNTLTEAMENDSVGEAIIDGSSENVHVINELDVPVIAIGLRDVIISASPEGILVSDKVKSSYIKPIVDSLNQLVMFADKSWGTYKVLDIGKESMTIKVTLKSGEHMFYHSHERRDEVWTVISGRGRTIVDGMEQPIKVGDVITMAAGCKHTVIAETELQMIEVQLGKDISVADKRKYELEI